MKSVFGCLGFLVWLCSRSLVCAQCSTCLEGKCYDTGECILGCVAGYLDTFCDKTCPGNCLNASCYTDRRTGRTTCTNGCEPGYCGSKCLSVCPTGCMTCDRQCNTCNVTPCPDGRYGADCSQTCDPNYEKCDRESGKCIRCRRGYYGDNCDQKCTTCFTGAREFAFNCQSGCDRCRFQESCSPGSYGDNCDKTCSRNCGSSNSDQDKLCNRATGECSAGCQVGYHGQTCNYTCSELCVSRICNQPNGTCEDGCISGYKTRYGLCERYSDEETRSVLPFVLPSVLVLIGVCVCVTVFVIRRHKRRRKYNKRKWTTDTELEEVTTPLQTDTDNQPNDSKDTVTKPLLNLNNQDNNGKSDNSQQQSSDSSDPELLPEEKLQIKRLRERCTEEIYTETKDMIRVSAVDTVIQKLKTGQNWVTITGNAGDGKTTLGNLVLKEFLDKMSVYKIEEPEEYKILSKLKEDRLILFDDRFGAFTSDLSLIKNWVSVINKILNNQEKSSSDQKQTNILFISRKNVVKESQDYLGHCKDKMFDPKCVVDLSTIKVIGDREKILNYHLHQENLTVDPEVKKRVIDLNIAHGFPHCCKMYSKLKSKGYDIDIEEFFQSPLKFLDITTRILYRENCKDLFQFLIKNDGKFNVFSIMDEEKRHALLQVEREQEGSYITTWTNGVCVFAHPSVYESVLNVINDIDPLYCVQYATLSVIRQKMVVSTSDDTDKDKSACYIIVKPVPEVLQTLAERFREEILKGDYSVFQHRLCDNKEFCEALVTCCVCTDQNIDDTKQYINKPGRDRRGREEETMLWTALRSNKITAVCTLVKHGADVNMKDQSGITPLHYLCQDKHDEIDLVTIQCLITEEKADVTQVDKYGKTPLLYLCEHETINVDLVKWMITEWKADVNQAEQHKSTSLHYLCDQRSVDPEFVQFVITEGKGDINKGDEHGSTPLHYLCRNEGVDVDAVLQVINTGTGDINKTDNNGITPLHYLCTRSINFDLIQSLIKEFKGDINKADQYGNTPLHYLCRREGIDVSTCQLELKQIPGADLMKTNKVGHTPLDYLHQPDKMLPWTEGMVDRSAADLVMCRLRGGENWIPVLGPAMTLSAERVHKLLKVEDGDRELNNMAESGERPGQFSLFKGTCSSPIPLPSSPFTLTTPRYWETNSRLLWKMKAGYPLLEMGATDERNLDALYVSHLPRSRSVSVQDDCFHHRHRLCIQVYSGCTQVGDCISLSPPTPGTQFNLTFGLVLDVGRGRLGLIDVERGKLLHKFDVKFEKECVPMFYVCPFKHDCEVRMRLVSGREMSVTDSKIKLIQEALSD